MMFKIYKRGQGKYTRLCSAFAVLLITGLGCMRLYAKLEATDVGLWVVAMAPVCLFGVFAAFIYWAVNKPSLANFMIAAEGEMKKVSWSSRREIVVSTIIVIAVVILMASLLGATDLSFRMFFSWLLS